jgi:hypothetical protein
MNIERLLQRIRLGEDSTIELKQVEVGLGGQSFELDRSETLSGRRPVYENLDDMELLLTIYAAPPPPATSTTMNV